MNKNQKVSIKDIEGIILESKEKLQMIFGENLLFGFICGGIANGYATYDHDIDYFICVKSPISKETYTDYLKWYFDIHKRYNLSADVDYPGEIVTYDQLMSTINILYNLKLTLQIKSIAVKKSIIWTDMIVGQIVCVVGNNLEELDKIRRNFAHFPQQWKEDVLKLISPREKSLWKKKSHLLLMEHFMKYPKYDGKKLKIEDYI